MNVCSIIGGRRYGSSRIPRQFDAVRVASS